MNRLLNIPELLAPAGNMECLHAAVCAGADAVYLGLDAFNARRNADNFTIETLNEACEYAHLRGTLIYVTLNVEILPGELESALDCARKACEAGADAFIVQDIGLAVLHRVETDLADYAVVEQQSKVEGRQAMMVFAPKKKMNHGNGVTFGRGRTSWELFRLIE